ncbi:MAG: type II toxin-antitoxin system HicB family antitoxin [Gammaproteobacteria bacterium]|nr:type II toxin-antitoxin system HicB family antitoxin [Gammaproteobacteria bacterium]
MRFPIVIHKERKSDYGVIVPDLPGCFSAGTTLDEAIENAHEAIECHLEGLLLDGDSIPKRQSLELMQKNADYAGGIWVVVEVDISKLSGKVTRVNITLSERVLAVIDEAARREGESRSGLLARAALEYVDKHKAA